MKAKSLLAGLQNLQMVYGDQSQTILLESLSTPTHHSAQRNETFAHDAGNAQKT
jgi:hypothetical protein